MLLFNTLEGPELTHLFFLTGETLHAGCDLPSCSTLDCEKPGKTARCKCGSFNRTLVMDASVVESGRPVIPNSTA